MRFRNHCMFFVFLFFTFYTASLPISNCRCTNHRISSFIGTNTTAMKNFSSPCCHLVRQIYHAQVRLYFEAEGGEAGHAILWSGELMEDDGILRVQLLLLSTQRTEIEKGKYLINVSISIFFAIIFIQPYKYVINTCYC